MNRPTLVVLLVWAALAGGLVANAQPVTTLYSFVRGPINPFAGLTLGNDGNFYGTTAAGGRNLGGTVFRMATNGALTTLFQFNGYPSGSGPRADLTLGSDGLFYGTAATGGTNLSGTDSGGVVFRMTTNGIPTTVVNFNGTNGGSPQAAVILGPDGYYYGTTRNGSTNGNGTVFKVSTNGTLTTLVYFNGANGANPVSCLTLAPGGTFYGTTKAGGQFGGGTAFKLTTNGDFTMLHSFKEETILSSTAQNTEGAGPAGRMALGPDGNLYGTTAEPGSAFQMTTNGVVTTLYNFDVPTGNTSTNGDFPYSGLTLGPDGNFYGTTAQGNTNGTGTIFQVSTNGILAALNRLPGIQYQYVTNSQGFVLIYWSTNNFTTSTFAGTTGTRFLNGVLTTLYSFSALTNSDNGDGADPESDLTLGPDGNLYGTTVGGGTNGAGAVFKISTNGTFTALASFAGNTGYNPEAGVTAGPGKSLYGVVKSGGTTGYGTAYKVTLGGQFTLLNNFSYFPNGANPQASLIQGPDGNFYGTASGGGTNLLQTGPNSYLAESFGTVFKLATNGAFTMLAYFSGTNGANPYGRLAIGPDGNFYGTTSAGGISNNGVVFELLTNGTGTLTALTNFIGANGAIPYEGLTLGPDGNFYGTTEAGGSNNNGTVFQVTPAGALKTLVYFNGTNGANPNDRLMLGRDGNLYGTTYTSTPDNGGTVFQVTTGGTFINLYSFVRTNFVFTHGQHPVGGLAQGPDDYLYGTTSLGGVNNSLQGTLFKISTNGVLTTLYSFLIPNGSAPFATLTLQTNSHFINFYGTTLGDGGDHPGTVFRVNLTTSYIITENTSATFLPLTNEVVWTTGGVLGLLTAVPTNGTTQISGSGIVFTPTTNFTGTATISYTVTDNAGGTNASFITILVTNIPPVANPDFYTVAENSSANVLSPLVNDLPVTSGGVLGLVKLSATNGTAVISGTNVLFTPTASFTGTATIGYTITDNIGGTNTSLITVTVVNVGADTSLSASAAPEPVGVGSNLVYSITVSNAGPAAASGVLVSNQIPAGVTFVSATGGATPAGGILQMNLGALAAGATNLVQIIVQPTSLGELTNLFQVFANETDPVLTNNAAKVISTVTNAPPVNLADLSLRARAAPEPVGVGSNLVYSLTVSNAGPATATGVVVSNQIPAGVTFVSTTGGVMPSGNILQIDLGPLAAGATNLVQIVVQPAAAGKLTNVFRVFANEMDPVLTNNFAIVVSTVTNAAIAQADLKLSASGPTDVYPQTANTSPFTNIITVINLGPSAATGVVVSNQIVGYTVVSVTGGATPTNGVLLVNLGTLAAGATNSIKIAGWAILPPGLITNLFQVFANETDPVPTNNFATLIAQAHLNQTIFTTSTAEYDTNHTTIVNQQINKFSTELIAKLPNGTIVFDQAFNAPFSDPTVQAAVTQAAGVLAGDGAASYTGPTPTSSGQTTNSTSVTVTNSTDTNSIVGTKKFIGPVTLSVGDFGLVQGYTFDSIVTNYAIPTGGNPQSLTLDFGGVDFDTMVLNIVTINQTTTNLSTHLNTAVYVMTGIVAQASADLRLGAKAAPEPVTVGSNLTYIISITNRGPSTATGVTVSNQIPASASFISATGGAVPAGGVLLINLGTLASNAVTSAQIIVQPTATGKLTNLFSVFADQSDPVLTNNSATVVSTVTNGPPLPVDVALSIMAAPNPVNVGDPLTYSLTVTNNNSATATGVVVSNTLPPNVTLNSVLPSQGTFTTSGRLVKIAVGNLPNGAAATIAIVAIPTAAGQLTNKATASSAQTDSQPANNSVQIVTTSVGVPVTNLVLTVLSGITLNPQTGLYEQRVQVFNGGPAPATSVLVLVSGLAANATLYNAAGKTNGVPYAQSVGPLNVGDTVVFTLEYFVPNRVTPSHLTLITLPGPPMIQPNLNGTIMNISRMIGLPNGSILVEFNTILGRIYAVQYSSDMATWLTAVPVIEAHANRIQWIDTGPPKTDVNPAQAPARYYRVILLP